MLYGICMEQSPAWQQPVYAGLCSMIVASHFCSAEYILKNKCVSNIFEIWIKEGASRCKPSEGDSQAIITCISEPRMREATDENSYPRLVLLTMLSQPDLRSSHGIWLWEKKWTNMFIKAPNCCVESRWSTAKWILKLIAHSSAFWILELHNVV